MTRLLAMLSLLNTCAALGLTIVYLTNDQPVLVFILASGMALQGLFTIAVLGGSFRSRQHMAEWLVIAGSAVAFVVGVAALTYGLLANFGAADPEFGPITAALLIAAHGGAALMHLWPGGVSDTAVPEERLQPVG